jgi:hypothetical protein
VLLVSAVTIYMEGEIEIQQNVTFTPYYFPRF